MRDQTPFLFPFIIVVVSTLIVMAVVAYPITFYLYEILFNSFVQEQLHETFAERHFDVGDTRIDLTDAFRIKPALVVGLIHEALKICLDVGIRLILIGTYFYAIARSSGIDCRWEHWFGFSCWTNIPMIVYPSVVLTVGTYAITQPKSYVFLSVLWFVLFFLPLLWSVYITVQGLRSWIPKDTAFCVKVAVVPYAVITLLCSPGIFGSFMFQQS